MKNTLQMYEKSKEGSTFAVCFLIEFNSFLEFPHPF
jgi:hypothetical protein